MLLYRVFQVCEERFAKRMDYSRHMRSHADHGNGNSGNQSDLICPGCTDVIPLIARTFSNQASLNVHMRAMHPHLTTKPAVPRLVSLFVCISFISANINNISYTRNTPYSKRKYTLCFRVITQNVGWVEPATGYRDSQSVFCNNQVWVCEKIPSGSKVPRKGLLGGYVRKFTKSVFAIDFFVTG